ncbi:hypothetical protein QCC63_09590, partial [Escherichia coli]|nr:hypothetical protein [Escherichia coli]
RSGAQFKNDGHYFCRAGGNRPDGLNEPVTINQHVWQDLGIHINIHRSESIKNVGNPGTIFCAAHICFHV